MLLNVAAGTKRGLSIDPRNVLGRSLAERSAGITGFRWISSRRLLLQIGFEVWRVAPESDAVANDEWQSGAEAIPQLRTANSPAYVLPSGSFTPAYSGFSAVDVDGKNWVNLPGAGIPLQRALPDRAAPALVWNSNVISPRRAKPGSLLVCGMESGKREFPDLFEIDTLTGGYARVMKNPGNVVEWVFDEKGEVRFSVTESTDGVALFEQTPTMGRLV